MSEFKSYGWGILRAGSPVFDECCVAPTAEGLEDSYAPEHGETLVELFYRVPPPAEEPREVVEPAPQPECGLPLLEGSCRYPATPGSERCWLHSRRAGEEDATVEPAPAPEQRYRCEGCGWEGEAADLAINDGHVAIVRDANGDPEPNLCGPCVPVTDAQPAPQRCGDGGPTYYPPGPPYYGPLVEPAPATVRWLCEGCKRSVPGYRVRGGPPTEHWHWNEGDSMAMYTCGPCVPVTDAQPAGAAP